MYKIHPKMKSSFTYTHITPNMCSMTFILQLNTHKKDQILCHYIYISTIYIYS